MGVSTCRPERRAKKQHVPVLRAEKTEGQYGRGEEDDLLTDC